MYILKGEYSFDSAHFLAGYEGKCSNIHGHRWRVIAEIYGEELKQDGQLKGMIIDFGDIKKDIKKMVDDHDHALIIEKNTLKNSTLICLKEEGFNIIELPFRPTAEEFSRYFYEILEGKGYSVKRVTVYETPTNSATYEK